MAQGLFPGRGKMTMAALCGTCARSVRYTLKDDGTLSDVRFAGGCDGNLKGLGRMLEGMPAREVIERLEGITCGSKPTSCPDQLARVLREALDSQHSS